MTAIVVAMSPRQHGDVLAHLLPPAASDEEAAFLFVREDPSDQLVLRLLEWTPIERSGFAYQSSGYLELVDEQRGKLIKRAHDLDASMVEMHSHPYPYPAEFSPTDLAGLAEFVPHVRWRLRKKPYVAIVVAPSGFDSLAWTGDSTEPASAAGLLVGEQPLAPTGNTLHQLSAKRGAR